MADLSFLRTLPRFTHFSDEELADLGAACVEIQMKAGAHVLRQYATEHPAAYFIKDGKVRIVRQEDRVRRVLATLGPGDFFGEMALIDHGPRSASADCATEATLVALTQERFDELEIVAPALALKLLKSFARELAARLRSSNERLVEREKFFPGAKPA